ncbi:MAG TPA: DoxX family protein [Gemmatimonadales bacterium]|nr:DoxX family protein [Gemmatimonadales bacterium]
MFGPSVALDTALLIARLVFGLAMAAHGSQKLFGWFGGYGLAGTGGFFESLGFRPGKRFALAAGLSEFGGGVLVALGMLGPVGPALVVSVMLVAAVTVHLRNPFFASTNGMEVPLLYSASAVALALAGPGAYSLDAVLGLDFLWTLPAALIALGAGVLGGVANLVLLRHKPVAA